MTHVNLVISKSSCRWLIKLKSPDSTAIFVKSGKHSKEYQLIRIRIIALQMRHCLNSCNPIAIYNLETDTITYQLLRAFILRFGSRTGHGIKTASDEAIFGSI